MTPHNGRRCPQADMSSQQFPRSGAPPTGLGPAPPPPIPTSVSAGLIAPAAAGKRAPGRAEPRPPPAAAVRGQLPAPGASADPDVPAPRCSPVPLTTSPVVPGGVRLPGCTGCWVGGAGQPGGRVAASPGAASVAKGRTT